MFDNLRRNISRLVYPEVHIDLGQCELRNAELVRANTAVHDRAGRLAHDYEMLRASADRIKALNWDHLIESHESGELEDAFVVCRLDEHGVLSPITCQKDELSSAVYLDRLKHGAVKAD